MITHHQITNFCNVLPLKLLKFPASKDKINNLIIKIKVKTSIQWSEKSKLKLEHLQFKNSCILLNSNLKNKQITCSAHFLQRDSLPYLALVLLLFFLKVQMLLYYEYDMYQNVLS